MTEKKGMSLTDRLRAGGWLAQKRPEAAKPGANAGPFAPQPASSTQPQPFGVPQVSVPFTVPSRAPTGAELVDPQIKAELDHAMSLSKFSGVAELQMAVAAMANIPGLNDAQRFAAAFQSLSATGKISRETLQACIQDRRRIVDAQRSSMVAEIDSAEQVSVGQKLELADKKRDDIVALRAQIVALESEEANLRTSAASHKQQVDLARAKIEATCVAATSDLAAFEATIAQYIR